MITNELQHISAVKNGGSRLLCGDISGKCAKSFGDFANLMLNLMSVEI